MPLRRGAHVAHLPSHRRGSLTVALGTVLTGVCAALVAVPANAGSSNRVVGVPTADVAAGYGPSVEGEAMTVSDTRSGTPWMSGASQGRARMLYRNSNVAARLTTPGADRLTLRLQGESFQGAPEVVVTVDGQNLRRETVAGTEWVDLVIDGTWTAGEHLVEVAFVNDHYERGVGDRNLAVDHVAFHTTEPPPDTRPEPEPDPVPEPDPAPDLGTDERREVRLGAVLATTTDHRPHNLTRDAVDDALFRGPRSVAAFVAASTHGRTTVSGDTFGPYDVPVPGDGCFPDGVEDQARAAARADGVDIDGYDRRIVVAAGSACRWAGLASLGGDAVLNGTTDVAAHEFGHSLGLDHATALDCRDGGRPVAIAEDCTVEEYGDPFDTMGASTFLYSGFNRSLLGTYDGELADSVAVIDRSRRLTVDSVDTPGGLDVVQIPAGDAPGRAGSFYTLETRTVGGTFNQVTGDSTIADGVVIRLTPAARTPGTTRLIDTRPDTPTRLDAPLTAGRTFRDLAAGISVTVVSVSDGEATIDLVLD